MKTRQSLKAFRVTFGKLEMEEVVVGADGNGFRLCSLRLPIAVECGSQHFRGCGPSTLIASRSTMSPSLASWHARTARSRSSPKSWSAQGPRLQQPSMNHGNAIVIKGFAFCNASSRDIRGGIDNECEQCRVRFKCVCGPQRLVNASTFQITFRTSPNLADFIQIAAHSNAVAQLQLSKIAAAHFQRQRKA
jgi:hypothetical protein